MRSLQQALAALLQAAPSPITRAVHVERAFTIDHQTGWRVYQIVTAENPLAATPHVPARTAMRRLLKAAARRRVPAPIVTRVSDAFEEFERFVTEHAGDRSTLESMLGIFLPQEREKAELAGKQAAFKGMSQIRGFCIEAEVQAHFLYPSADNPSRVDTSMLRGLFGLRRVNPNASVSFGWRALTAAEQVTLSLDRKPVKNLDDFLLTQYCSSPLPHFEAREFEDEWCSFIPSGEIGLRSAADIVLAEHGPSHMKRFRTSDGRRRTGLHFVQDSPIRRFTVDIFVHRDVYPDSAATLDIYEAVSHGPPMFLDHPKHERDRLHMHEKVVPLTHDLQQVHLDHVPRYPEMLAHVYTRLGLDPRAYRGYRLDVQFPVYGAVYMLGFVLPEQPSAAHSG